MGQKSILVIDDDEVILLALQAIIEKENFRVFTATNGQEALEVLTEMPRPCVILLDLMMPVMDGWEFLDVKKKNPTYSSIPTIVISAFSDQAKKVNAAVEWKNLDSYRDLLVARLTGG